MIALIGVLQLVAHDRKEFGFGAVGGLRRFLRTEKRGLCLLALGDVVAHRLVLHRVALVILDGALGPPDPEPPSIFKRHLGLEGVRLVRNRGAGSEVGEIDPDQFGALAVDRARVGAVHERDLPVILVAADEIGLVLDYPLVARLNLLERTSHPLDLARQSDDLVGIRLVAD